MSQTVIGNYTVITTHESPPIPIRCCDWSAYRDGYEEGPVGWGATEAAALEDLRIQLEEE